MLALPLTAASSPCSVPGRFGRGGNGPLLRWACGGSSCQGALRVRGQQRASWCCRLCPDREPDASQLRLPLAWSMSGEKSHPSCRLSPLADRGSRVRLELRLPPPLPQTRCAPSSTCGRLKGCCQQQ
jgi:hypothetical protein